MADTMRKVRQIFILNYNRRVMGNTSKISREIYIYAILYYEDFDYWKKDKKINGWKDFYRI